MPNYQDTFTKELMEAIVEANASRDSEKPKHSASKRTDEEHKNLLETFDENVRNDFKSFADKLAKDLSEGKENLGQEEAERDSNEVLKIMYSGQCNGIKEPKTLIQAMNAVGTNETGNRTAVGPFTAKIIKEEQDKNTPKAR